MSVNHAANCVWVLVLGFYKPRSLRRIQGINVQLGGLTVNGADLDKNLIKQSCCGTCQLQWIKIDVYWGNVRLMLAAPSKDISDGR